MLDTTDHAHPFFGWLDYREDDAEAMRRVLASFDEKNTVDSLGIGVVRDSISGQLFPGISTIQTRARYYFFVPWICAELEAKRVGPDRFSKRLRSQEVSLIARLLEGNPVGEPGIIGRRAGKRLTRLPSTTYWSGLGAFGVRQADVSIAWYCDIAAADAARFANRRTDDDGESLDLLRSTWDRGLPAIPQNFFNEPVSLTLSEEEAEYLTSKIAGSQPGTLLAELVRDQSIDLDVAAPWMLKVPSLDAATEELLVHARNFAELMEGAQLLYNVVLARRAETEFEKGVHEEHDHRGLLESLQGDLAEWASVIEARHSELDEWIGAGAFWETAAKKGNVPQPTKRFIQNWAALALRSPSTIATNKSAAELITERERRLKGRQARLVSRRALEQWNGQPFNREQMRYRWSTVQQIVGDITSAGRD